MSIIREAYFRLLDVTEKSGEDANNATLQFPYEEKITYSGHFKDYNASVQLRGNRLEFKLSKKWEEVSHDIVLGLIQELIIKLFKKRGKKFQKTTLYIDLYHTFLSGVHRTIPKTKNDNILAHHFQTINNRYFFGVLEQPNVVWGKFSLRTLGHYDYGTDTITMSRALHPACDCPDELLQYVLYHEMLHKKHKFRGAHGKTFSHTAEFRRDEEKFENAKLLEKQLTLFLSKQKRRKSLLSFFR